VSWQPAAPLCDADPTHVDFDPAGVANITWAACPGGFFTAVGTTVVIPKLGAGRSVQILVSLSVCLAWAAPCRSWSAS
jgi:hypothetical protein